MGAASCASVRRAVNKEAVGSDEQMAVPAPGPATAGQWAGAVGRPQPRADGSWHMGARSKGVRAQGGGMVLPSTLLLLLLLPLPAPAGNFPARLGECCGDPAVAQDFVSLKINTLEDTRASKLTVGPAGAAAVCPQPPRHGRQCSLPSLAPALRRLLAPRAPKLKGPHWSSLLSRAPSPSFPLR